MPFAALPWLTYFLVPHFALHLEWNVYLHANFVAVYDTYLVCLIIKSNCRSGNMECKINHLIIIFLSFVKLPCS